VNSKEKVLIVTDGTEAIQQIARSIENVLIDYNTEICSGDVFAGTDLLPSEIFFLGCEKPHPSSFAYLAKMLSHINLAGRKCGIFSTDEKALNYLGGLVKDSEAGLGDPFLAAKGELRQPALKKWLKGIVK
jgi:hypothetical protein